MMSQIVTNIDCSISRSGPWFHPSVTKKDFPSPMVGIRNSFRVILHIENFQANVTTPIRTMAQSNTTSGNYVATDTTETPLPNGEHDRREIYGSYRIINNIIRSNLLWIFFRIWCIIEAGSKRYWAAMDDWWMYVDSISFRVKFKYDT